MTRVKGRKLKRSQGSNSPQKAKLSKIRSAISQFISKTEKIVRSISPHARILLPRLLAHKRPRLPRSRICPPKPKVSDRPSSNSVILTPQYKGTCELEIALSDVPCESDCDSENTDDEQYSALHSIREKIEGLLTTHLEVRKVKRHGRENGDCRNADRNLHTLAEFLSPAVQNEYLLEGIDTLPWPDMSPKGDLKVSFCGAVR